MKKMLVYLMGLLVVGGVAFLGGRWVERTENGYHYQVLEEKEIEGADGPIRWRAVDEHVGFPFLETETTVIEVAGRTIYKAKRTFQETHPYAQNVRAKDGLIEWDDGEFAFSLKMQLLPPAAPVTQRGATLAMPTSEPS